MLSKRKKYRYEDYHKEIDGVLYKKCAYHKEIFGEEKWFPCTSEYFYINSKNKSDGLHPECKECSYKKARKWAIENPEKKRESCRKNSMTNKTREYHRKNTQRQRNNGWRKDWEKKNRDKLRRYNLIRRLNKIHEITGEEWIACKAYFGNSCAYCGMSEEEHKKKFGEQLHKEHVKHDGNNGLGNCVPSCKICNSEKNIKTLEEWYNTNNIKFNLDRLHKIYSWIYGDYNNYISEKFE